MLERTLPRLRAASAGLAGPALWLLAACGQQPSEAAPQPTPALRELDPPGADRLRLSLQNPGAAPRRLLSFRSDGIATREIPLRIDITLGENKDSRRPLGQFVVDWHARGVDTHGWPAFTYAMKSVELHSGFGAADPDGTSSTKAADIGGPESMIVASLEMGFRRAAGSFRVQPNGRYRLQREAGENTTPEVAAVLASTLPRLPGEAVGVGARWRVHEVIQDPNAGPLDVAVDYVDIELLALDDHGFRLRFTSKSSAGSAPWPPADWAVAGQLRMEMRMLESRMSGDFAYTFDDPLPSSGDWARMDRIQTAFNDPEEHGVSVTTRDSWTFVRVGPPPEP